MTLVLSSMILSFKIDDPTEPIVHRRAKSERDRDRASRSLLLLSIVPYGAEQRFTFREARPAYGDIPFTIRDGSKVLQF